VRKKVDARVRTLIENSMKTRTRSFFVIVGDRGKDQVVNLHYMMSKAAVKARPSVLWCYNKELGFSTLVTAPSGGGGVRHPEYAGGHNCRACVRRGACAGTGRSGCGRSRSCRRVVFTTRTRRTRSSCSSPPPTSDGPTTRRRTRCSATRSACVCCRCVRPWERQALLKAGKPCRPARRNVSPPPSPITAVPLATCCAQDFEAVTPNILCRTIETVEGGGVVVLLLHTMAMDVHARFRTEAHQDVVGRFNERFILSLASAQNCLVLDDELNVLPIR
jgi:hypothetical protein